MAATEFGSNSPQAVKRWSDMLMRETFGKMSMTTLISRGENACIQLKTELSKSAGDEIRYDLLAQDRSAGVNGDAKLEGFEVPLTFFQDTLTINQKRNAHTFRNMSQQRTVHDLRASGRFSLSQWYAWFIEGGLLAHFAGVSGDGNESVIGVLGADTGQADFAGNTLTALDADHLIDNSGVAMALTFIDEAVAQARVINPRIAPLMINGEKKYILYLHPFSVLALKTAAGATGWNQIQQNAQVRGQKNPIYTGALGEYQGVILRESEFVASVGSVRHNVMLGEGAGCIAFGNAWDATRRASAGGGSHFDWVEQVNDYGNEKGVGAAAILGFKRAQFNSKAFGVMGLQTLDAAP
jgi:N4-gp56 family major capsid protein